jgi:hypothetical protein
MIIATEGRGKKLALITERFSTYMDPLYRVSKGKTGEADSGKRDYRNPGAGEKMKMREGSTTLSFSQNFPS